MPSTASRRRGGGRSDRLRQRAAGPPNPCPPGQHGGQYRPLADAEIVAIHDTALRLLAELGMGEVPDRLRADLLEAGAREGSGGRVLFPRDLVGEAISTAPKTVTLHARDPDRTIEVGGDRVHFGTGGAAVQTLDMETGLYRPSTLADLHDFTRLQDTLPNVSWFTRCCVATDLEDNYELDVNTVHALVRNTTKPVATSFTLAEYVPPVVEMLDIVAGGPGAFSERPFLAAHISPVILWGRRSRPRPRP